MSEGVWLTNSGSIHSIKEARMMINFLAVLASECASVWALMMSPQQPSKDNDIRGDGEDYAYGSDDEIHPHQGQRAKYLLDEEKREWFHLISVI